MAAVTERLTDEECCLLAILTDPSGIDLAEFAWFDPETQDAWRAWPFQWKWFRCSETLQIDQSARAVGKSLSIKLRAFAFPFVHPGQEMVITAPELVHLNPIIGLIERQYEDTRLGREMVVRGRSGVTHRPFQMNLNNGSRIIGRIPQTTGRGVKGIHPIWLEMDEAQDYPKDGWTELTETLQMGKPGAVWRAHGVTRGVQDEFYDHTQDTPDNEWKVHRIVAMARPNWTDAERQKKIREYGGSRDAPDYRRNVLGLHGDATNPLFVMHRFMRCCDTIEGSAYNATEYEHFNIKAEMLEDRAGYAIEDQIRGIIQMLDFSVAHKSYGGGGAVWAGMDVGFTADPTEILVFVEYEPTMKEAKADEAAKRALPEGGLTRLRLLTRITLQRIGAPLQVEVIKHVVDHYRPRAFGMDKMQPVSEPVLTPKGWKPIGDLGLGEHVVGSNGEPTRVTGIYPQVDRRVMRVYSDDGSWTRCGPEHLWVVEDTQSKGARMKVTTEQLAALVARQRQRRYRLPMLSAPVQHEATVPLPLDPYLLGILLGDGNLRRNSVRLSSADPEILSEVEARLPDGVVVKSADGCDYELASTEGFVRGPGGRFMEGRNPLVTALRGLGLLATHSHTKFIPELFLRAAWGDRLELLRGIMDADGWIDPKTGSIGIRSSSDRLASDVLDLIEGLGGLARKHEHRTRNGDREGRLAHKLTVIVPTGLNPFKLSRKANAVKERRRPVQRFVDRIEWDRDEDSVCIRVEAEDHLYVTRHHLLTHNTGNGLPLFQAVQASALPMARVIKGYNFSEKVIVDIDGTVTVGEGEDILKEAAIKSNVLEYSTDCLRGLVDQGRLMLPFEGELIREFNGQTFSYSKNPIDQYGRRRRIFSQGHFHALDGARMAAMAHAQHAIEEFIEAQKQDNSEPVFDYFISA